MVDSVRRQIQEVQTQKDALETEFPVLVSLGHASTNALGINVAVERAKITALGSRVVALNSLLSNVQAQAMSVMQITPEIERLQRQREEDRRNYERYVESVKTAQMNAEVGLGKITSFSIVQTPTPPQLDNKFLQKLLLGVFGGCVGAGFGLAFLLELVLNRTLRRASDVQRRLGMRLFLTIPDRVLTQGSGRRLRLPWSGRNGKAHAQNGANGEEPAAVSDSSVAPWEAGHRLWAYAEALRDRLITYFEVHNLTHKPKLVGVTSCGEGAGVSTIASGLAAALSETGDGNVLLVDMNLGQGAAHAFYKGKPACGVGDVLEPGSRSDAQVQENLYLASMHAEKGAKGDLLPRVLPKRFMHLVPKLKASDYDYIIFDMPPITQTSVTPRLAGHMDMVLMVLEAEKTGQHLAGKAGELLQESRANVAAVLNKYRRYLPAGLSQEL
jgi:Mrp family chromosome partitioning ATPase